MTFTTFNKVIKCMVCGSAETPRYVHVKACCCDFIISESIRGECHCHCHCHRLMPVQMCKMLSFYPIGKRVASSCSQRNEHFCLAHTLNIFTYIYIYIFWSHPIGFVEKFVSVSCHTVPYAISTQWKHHCYCDGIHKWLSLFLVALLQSATVCITWVV